MDVKDLRTVTALSERNNDGSKYSQSGVALQCNRTKSYQDMGSNPLAKTESAPVRPCAVIGPDRVVPPSASNESWPGTDGLYRRPPEYPHKIITSNQNPTRNISPRQTFQENMQRFMVPPTYNAVRHSDDVNFNHLQDKNVAITKNIKTNVASEAKYCEVPYGMNTLPNEPKNVRDTDIYVPSVNPVLTRTAPQGWPPAGVSMHAPRTYSAHELYQYPQYQSCTGQRPPLAMARPPRTIQDDPAYVYSDHYQDGNSRFKPYPTVKDRIPQGRYEYIPNYPSQFHHPPPIQPHKYDIPKPGQSYPYPVYPHLKYIDNRVPDHIEGFQRPTNPQYNIQFRNQVIHPNYAQLPGNSPQNKLNPYAPEGSVKAQSLNKLPYDSNSKMFIDYENSRTKAYPVSDNNYFVNEMGRMHPVKHQMVIPNYASVAHSVSSQQYYRKEIAQMKPFEYMPHFRNFDPNMNMMRHAPQFSPNTLAISPSDSNTSNDTSHTHGTSQEDCGYVSQSSTASIRSVDSGLYKLPHEYYKRYDYRYGPIIGNSASLTKSDLNTNNANSKNSKQKQIDVRQFLQMWNEGEEENNENNNSKEIVIQTGSSDTSSSKPHSNQDQLYVLGLVNVPSEELSKYEHIQKISKLPENIKGYNSLELLSQFEEALESSKIPSFKSIPKEFQNPSKVISPKRMDPRPLSPLDVEAKISQSVIHKEVGCNFEIRPCSPKMLNVEVAAPAQNILGERVIEKVTNPLSNIVKSPATSKPDENSIPSMKRQDNTFAITDNPSCNMIRSPCASNNIDTVKTNYSLQDLEINSGISLASLPRLDNEIELNFPEVNQQFINANKIDDNPTSISYPRKFEVGFGYSDTKFIKTDTENILVVNDSDKSYTRLSKFRKLKTNSADQSDNNELTQAVRTDSVIIKNPESLKNIEDKSLENCLPMNLSQSSLCHGLPEKLNENRDICVDIALDFSLNKSGNDLPIIDSEKDEVTKSLSTNLLDISYEKCIDSIDSCSKSTNFETTNSKDVSLTKCIKVDSDESDCVTENINHTSECDNHEDLLVSGILNNDIPTTIVYNPCESNLISQKCPTLNLGVSVCPNSNKINDKDVHKIETWQDSEYDNCSKETEEIQFHTNENTSDEDCKPNQEFVNQISPDPILQRINIFEKCDVIMDIECTVSEIKKITNVNKSNKNEQVISNSLMRNDFEKDEISVSLEKLFQENDEDTGQTNCENIVLSTLMSVSINSRNCHQSKELYSPWIQKLLTHSEGLCSTSADGLKQKEFIERFIQSSDESDGKDNDNMKVNSARDMNIVEKESMSKSLDFTTSKNETTITVTLDEPSTDNVCNTSKSISENFIKNEKESDKYKSGIQIQTSPEEDVVERLSDDSVVDSSCEINKCNLKAQKDDMNIKLKVQQDSSLLNIISLEEILLSNDEKIENKTNESCEAKTVKENDLLCDKSKKMCGDIIRNKSTISNLEKVTNNLVAPHAIDNQTTELITETSIDNVIKIHDNEPESTSEKQNCNNMTIEVKVQDDSQTSSLENVSDNCIKYQTKDKCIAEIIDNNISCQTEETFEIHSSSEVGPDISTISKSLPLHHNQDKTQDQQNGESQTNTKIEQISESVHSNIIDRECSNIDQEASSRQNAPKDISDCNINNQSKEGHEICVIENPIICKINNIDKTFDKIQEVSNSYKPENEYNIVPDINKGLQRKKNPSQDDLIKDVIEKDISNTHNNATEIFLGHDICDVTEKDINKTNVQNITNTDSDVYSVCHKADNQDRKEVVNKETISVGICSNKFECSSPGTNKTKSDLLHEDNVEIVTSPTLALDYPIQENEEIPTLNIHKGEKVLCRTHISTDFKSSILNCDTNEESDCSQVIENNDGLSEINAFKVDSQDIPIQSCPVKHRTLKRSYSDSVLNVIKNKDLCYKQEIENLPFVWPSKRQRVYELENSEQHVVDENDCSLIQSSNNNRRNSVSAFCNEQNVSFCILIDNNCIITEENEEEKICYAEIPEDCITEIDSINEEENVDEVICCSQENEFNISETVVLNYENEKSFQESWLDDVACVETVVSDDIEEDITVSGHASPNHFEIAEYNESNNFSCEISENLNEDNVAQNIEICRSPLEYTDAIEFISEEKSIGDNVYIKEIENELRNDLRKSESLENILTSPGYSKIEMSPKITNIETPDKKENMFKNITSQNHKNNLEHNTVNISEEETIYSKNMIQTESSSEATQNNDIFSSESIKNNTFIYKEADDKIDDIIPSSPEVSSTTSDEKNSSILLKITNYNGSRISEVNEIKHNKPRCKFTEKKEYANSYGNFPNRPLITKGAQKYIPPIKETISDLTVKLSLPQQRLLKLKQLKLSRIETKPNKHNNNMLTIPKKPKPNFEDVLKSIDEVQYKMHKEKSKKVKNVVPKVVIKKNHNGSHYTSSSNKESFNPDLTGRKWQPWVFLEKNHFIDKMAIRNKTKAVFNHRNNTYVLADKFKKYKSVGNSSAKFVISQPKSESSKGQLKYTIRLRHMY